MEAIGESNAYQDKKTTLQNKLNHKCTNAEVLYVTVATADAVAG
jgi:hypothetical protein